MNAFAAVGRAFSITVSDVLTDGAFYRELGIDYHKVQVHQSQSSRHQPTRSAGHTVTIGPLADTA
ncbi:hypothetical protein C6A85_95380 [Mycobacterium sp. ITM-2017-0098]|nr:hypothetical protein C6A85_95380 [Mycobacterium sp. ITM-2017-0098]